MAYKCIFVTVLCLGDRNIIFQIPFCGVQCCVLLLYLFLFRHNMPARNKITTYTTQEKTVFLGICRAVIAAISVTLSATLLANYKHFIQSEHLLGPHRARSIRSILIVICAVNVIHFLVSIGLFLTAKSSVNKPRGVKFWIILDLAICTINILCILILLFTAPPRTLFFILGATIIMFSLFFGYKSSAAYVLHKSDELGSTEYYFPGS